MEALAQFKAARGINGQLSFYQPKDKSKRAFTTLASGEKLFISSKCDLKKPLFVNKGEHGHYYLQNGEGTVISI